jgi:hypothetical protein
LSCFYGDNGQQSTVTSKDGVVTFDVGSALSANIVFKGGEGIVDNKKVKFEPQIVTFNIDKPQLIIDLVAIPDVVVPPNIPPPTIPPPTTPPIDTPTVPVVSPPAVVLPVETITPAVIVSQAEAIPWLLIISGGTVSVVIICATIIILFRMRKPNSYVMPTAIAKYRVLKEEDRY